MKAKKRTKAAKQIDRRPSPIVSARNPRLFGATPTLGVN